ncbi:MAG: ankyrin repeat domain-containing protein [Acidiferrobacteraceae bacterium]|jgi:ankyrin repeat protein
MACSHTHHCELFAQFALNPALQVWQTHYCESEFQLCARYQMSLMGETVPLNLLPNGATIEVPRSSVAYGAVALFNAILKGRVSMVESLLRHGVDVNVPNTDGTTALMLAVSRGNADIVRLLLARKTDPYATNQSGETVFTIAERGTNPEIAALLRRFDRSKRGKARSTPFWARWFMRKSA